MVQAGFKKGRVVKDQIASICCIMEKARAFEKNFWFIDYTKAFHCVDNNKFLKRKFTNFMCGKFLKRWEYQTTLCVSWETCMQLELDIEQQTSAKLGNKYDKAPGLFNLYAEYMWNASLDESQAGIKIASISINNLR